MCLLSQIDLSIYSSRESLKAAVLLSLLSVWVLVGLFYYLNHYTRRRYFTIWTAAWLFYALWITLSFGRRTGPPPPWLLMFQMWCIGVSAVFLFWGSERFVGERVRQRLIGFFLLFLLVWSYIGAYHMRNRFWIEVPLFSLIGIASVITAKSFLTYRRQHKYIGATLLSVGFLLWGVYMVSYPFLEASEALTSVALFISAVIQLLVAVSMIILVLEEFRATHQLAVEQIQLRKRERDVLQTKVTSTEERYRALFDQAGEAILITDTEALEILELNQAAASLLGVAHDEAGRHSLSSFCPVKTPGTEAPQTGAGWFEAIRTQQALTLVRKDGAQTQVEINGAKIYFDGRPAYQFFVREMTERARLEQQLRQAEKLSALGQMISGIAHELNNPLAIVKGYLELILAHHDLPPQTRLNLEKVAQESNRAAKLVRNFLSFAREQSTRRERVQFNEIIPRVVELRKFDLNAAGAELRMELDPNLSRTFADPDQVQQALLNLITNALQAIAEKPGATQLKIITRQTKTSVQIAVEDSGPGVPDQLQAKIFEPFFTTKRVGTGTGLGLSIAHSMMTDHKGRIFYETSSLGGAAFVLEFPITAIGMGAGAKEPAGSTPPIVTDQTPSGHVLVLDDEKALAEMIAEVLDILGHKTTVCHTAERALELMDKQHFDIIVSDFRMPDINGRQFYEFVKQRHPELAPRIIFVTGDVVNEETRSFLESTKNPHFEKPFNLASVGKAVAEVLGNGKAP